MEEVQSEGDFVASSSTYRGHDFQILTVSDASLIVVKSGSEVSLVCAKTNRTVGSVFKGENVLCIWLKKLKVLKFILFCKLEINSDLKVAFLLKFGGEQGLERVSFFLSGLWPLYFVLHIIIGFFNRAQFDTWLRGMFQGSITKFSPNPFCLLCKADHRWGITIRSNLNFNGKGFSWSW